MARNGGAMINLGTDAGEASPQLINCEFLGNSAANRGGAMVNDANNGGTSSPECINCIFQAINVIRMAVLFLTHLLVVVAVVRILSIVRLMVTLQWIMEERCITMRQVLSRILAILHQELAILYSGTMQQPMEMYFQ